MIVHWIEPTSAAPQPGLMVLLHGYGSHELDLAAMAPDLDPRWTIACLRAPYSTENGGNSWFDIEFTPLGIEIYEEQAMQSVSDVGAWIRAQQSERGIASARTLIGGFSQGSTLASGLLGYEPNLVKAAWLMSGTLFSPAREDVEFDQLSVLVQHGVHDPVVPFMAGRDVAEWLDVSGATVRFEAYSMAHQITPESLGDARVWMDDLFWKDAEGEPTG
jgi:phospholipase/carboxylesterase